MNREWQLFSGISYSPTSVKGRPRSSRDHDLTLVGAPSCRTMVNFLKAQALLFDRLAFVPAQERSSEKANLWRKSTPPALGRSIMVSGLASSIRASVDSATFDLAGYDVSSFRRTFTKLVTRMEALRQSADICGNPILISSLIVSYECN